MGWAYLNKAWPSHAVRRWAHQEANSTADLIKAPALPAWHDQS